MEDINNEDLPSRLFALYHYPTITKINAYSKLEYLSTIATALEDSEEMKWLLASPFGKLFKIPPNKYSFFREGSSWIFVPSIGDKEKARDVDGFCWSSYKVWFTRILYPTCMECGKYPKKRDVKEMLKVKDGFTTIWKSLFEEDDNLTVADLVKKLEREEMDDWKKLAISLIIIIDGILTCYTQPARPSSTTVKMTKDIKFFSRYPWGRMSFSRMLEMIYGFKNDEDVDKMVASLNEKMQQMYYINDAMTIFSL